MKNISNRNERKRKQTFQVSHKEGLEKDVEKLKHYTDMETHIQSFAN